jgi:hypothetical protein
MRVEFEVTQEDIDNAERQMACFCPVARSMKRKGFTAAVYALCIYPFNDSIQVAPPRSVTEFVKAYDRQDPVEPFCFALDIQAAGLNTLGGSNP